MKMFKVSKLAGTGNILKNETFYEIIQLQNSRQYSSVK